jgi:hypothetical protein
MRPVSTRPAHRASFADLRTDDSSPEADRTPPEPESSEAITEPLSPNELGRFINEFLSTND